MKVLVTGGSGYLGTYVRQFFSADDFSRRSGFDILDDQAAERVAGYDAVIQGEAGLGTSAPLAGFAVRGLGVRVLPAEPMQLSLLVERFTDRGFRRRS